MIKIFLLSFIISIVTNILYNKRDNILYKRIPIDTVYGEFIYGAAEKMVVYDLSKLPKSNIVGMTYYINETAESTIKNIADRALQELEIKMNYKYSKEEREEALKELIEFADIQPPQFFIAKNATLLKSRFNKRYYILEGGDLGV